MNRRHSGLNYHKSKKVEKLGKEIAELKERVTHLEKRSHSLTNESFSVETACKVVKTLLLLDKDGKL